MQPWSTASVPRCRGLVTSWRDHGYIVDLMTGSAWGGYQDYLDGKFDGADHWDQAQTDVDGKHIIHGGNPMVPYMSPGEDYGRYLSTGVKRALDQGVEAVYLEEPEFWARSGWSGNFKRRVAGLLRRAVAGAQLLAGCAVSRLEAEILPLSPRARAGL